MAGKVAVSDVVRHYDYDIWTSGLGARFGGNPQATEPCGKSEQATSRYPCALPEHLFMTLRAGTLGRN
jgi:hypothetical protein